MVSLTATGCARGRKVAEGEDLRVGQTGSAWLLLGVLRTSLPEGWVTWLLGPPRGCWADAC